MHIGPLPAVLRDIRDDGRSIGEIIATLETKNVAIFQRRMFEQNVELIPTSGTPYNFLATVARELPAETRPNVEAAFQAALRQHGDLRRPTLRSALLLMERMTQERLFADIFVMNTPVLNPDSGDYVYVGLGREDEEGQSWIAAAATDYSFGPDHDHEVILFLGPDV